MSGSIGSPEKSKSRQSVTEADIMVRDLRQVIANAKGKGDDLLLMGLVVYICQRDHRLLDEARQGGILCTTNARPS